MQGPQLFDELSDRVSDNNTSDAGLSLATSKAFNEQNLGRNQGKKNTTQIPAVLMAGKENPRKPNESFMIGTELELQQHFLQLNLTPDNYTA